MSLAFNYLLLRSICGIGNFVTADITAVFVNNNMILSDEDKILIKSLYLKGYTVKRSTYEFPENSWSMHGVNKLFKKVQDSTVYRRPGSGSPCIARTEENAKLLLQKFPQSATDFVLPIVRRSDQEHLFVRKENKVSGILQELLKKKLSALHASSADSVCQLLCTAPLETFQMQVLTNNLGYRRPMNTHFP